MAWRAVSPKRRRKRAVPPQPELLGMTRAKRSSWAPAQSAVLPRRDWPMTATAGVVDVIVGLEVVEGAAQAPGPGADGSPLVGGRSGLTGFVVEGMDAVVEAVVVVGVEVAIIDRCDGVAAFPKYARPASGRELFRGWLRWRGGCVCRGQCGCASTAVRGLYRGRCGLNGCPGSWGRERRARVWAGRWADR